MQDSDQSDTRGEREIYYFKGMFFSSQYIQPSLDTGMSQHFANVDVCVMQENICIFSGMNHYLREIVLHVTECVTSINKGKVNFWKFQGIKFRKKMVAPHFVMINDMIHSESLKMFLHTV